MGPLQSGVEPMMLILKNCENFLVDSAGVLLAWTLAGGIWDQ